MTPLSHNAELLLFRDSLFFSSSSPPKPFEICAQERGRGIMQSVAEVQATPSFHPWTTGGGLRLAMFGVSYVFAIQGEI